MNAGDFREYVVRPALQTVNLWSVVAEELLMGTAAQESGFQYLEQVRGPALGIFQIEPATHQDLWANYLRYRPELRRAALRWSTNERMPLDVTPDDSMLVWNLRYAAVICRLIYYRQPFYMPQLLVSPQQLGEIWKKVYNTYKGAGTVAQFVASYNRLVAGKSEVD